MSSNCCSATPSTLPWEVCEQQWLSRLAVHPPVRGIWAAIVFKHVLIIIVEQCAAMYEPLELHMKSMKLTCLYGSRSWRPLFYNWVLLNSHSILQQIYILLQNTEYVDVFKTSSSRLDTVVNFSSSKLRLEDVFTTWTLRLVKSYWIWSQLFSKLRR